MGRTALHVACRLEHVPLTKLILDMKDVNLDARMAVSQTPHHLCNSLLCIALTVETFVHMVGLWVAGYKGDSTAPCVVCWAHGTGVHAGGSWG